MICFHPKLPVDAATMALAAAGMVVLPDGKGGGTVVTAEMADEINRRKREEALKEFPELSRFFAWLTHVNKPED